MLACLVDGEPSTSRTVIASQLCDRAYRQRGEREVFEHWRAQLKWHAQPHEKLATMIDCHWGASLPTTSRRTRSRWAARREAGCSGTMAFSSAVPPGLQPASRSRWLCGQPFPASSPRACPFLGDHSCPTQTDRASSRHPRNIGTARHRDTPPRDLSYTSAKNKLASKTVSHMANLERVDTL